MYRTATFLLISLFFGCTGQKQRFDQVFALQQMNELAVTEVSVREMIPQRNEPYLVSVEATAKVDIDLKKLDTATVKADDKKIKLILPKPTLSFAVNPKSISMEYHEESKAKISLTEDMEKEILRKAELQLKNRLDSMQLLSKAEEKATSFLSEYLQSIGYTQISIRFNNSLPNEKKN